MEFVEVFIVMLVVAKMLLDLDTDALALRDTFLMNI